MRRRKLWSVRGVAVAAVAALGGTGLGVGAAGAESVLLSCTGMSKIVTMNPPTGSAGAKYLKWSVKDSDGTKFDLFGAPVPADALGCDVDTGIRTPNAATNSASGKDNPFDDQTNGHADLTTAGATAKSVMSLAGSGSCRTDVPDTSYPSAYPIQGKVITKFDQTDASSKPISQLSYVRLDADPLDAEGDIKVTGTVIKGPGTGGEVRATIALFPTNSTKNVNVIDCSPDFTPVPAGNAQVVEMKLGQADGSDAGTAIDPWVVAIP
jgi:hypothetical protein